MVTDRTAPVETAALAAEVEGLLEPAEADGVFRDTRECGGALLLAALLLISPPTPGPRLTFAKAEGKALAEQTQGAVPLSAVIADAATGVALALRGEGDPYALSGILRQSDALTPAAIRVLGADALAPYAMDQVGAPVGADDEAVVRQALTAYPPGADASEVSVWSYRGLVEASHAFLPGNAQHWPPPPEAAAEWVDHDPWPRLSHRVSQLAALALPGLAPGLTEQLATRTDDLARGFVRAVRRRDWLQAAGLGRWLARLPEVPESLGLDSGLAFVRQMGVGDPRVTLHIAAAQRFYGRGW